MIHKPIDLWDTNKIRLDYLNKTVVVSDSFKLIHHTFNCHIRIEKKQENQLNN